MNAAPHTASNRSRLWIILLGVALLAGILAIVLKPRMPADAPATSGGSVTNAASTPAAAGGLKIVKDGKSPHVVGGPRAVPVATPEQAAARQAQADAVAKALDPNSPQVRAIAEQSMKQMQCEQALRLNAAKEKVNEDQYVAANQAWIADCVAGKK